eukprot:1161879-Pelagomonas_calceolata.AAC.2
MFFDLLCKDQHAEQLNHQGGGELYTLTWPVAKQSHASAKAVGGPQANAGFTNTNCPALKMLCKGGKYVKKNAQSTLN